MLDTHIEDIVQKDFEFATVLQHYGIDFFKDKDLTLGEACTKNNVEVEKILAYKNINAPHLIDDVKEYDKRGIVEIVDVLIKSHDYFINSKLPDINELVLNLKPEYFSLSDSSKCEEIKFLFADFSFKFIWHMRLEEKGYFAYVKKLLIGVTKNRSAEWLRELVNSYSLVEFEKSHSNDDDELVAIGEITNNYSLDQSGHLYLSVLFKELQRFEKQLVHHARIEDSILLPKAIKIEKKVCTMLGTASSEM